jgi:hypothetical protein
LKGNLFAPPSASEIAVQVGRDEKAVTQLALLLEEEGEAVRLARTCFSPRMRWRKVAAVCESISRRTAP